MNSAVAAVGALLLSAAFLLMGNGLLVTVVPVRANLESFSSVAIGLIGASYFLGFAAGCYSGGRIVRRAGHVRTFSAMASFASVMALVHALFVEPMFWWIFRACTGFCFAVLYVVIESWLNERAGNDNRGRILAIYNFINLTVVSAGQMMLMLYDPGDFALFALASILISISVIPLAMTTAPAPAPVEVIRLRLRYLFRKSPVGCFGAFCVGLVIGAFWSMGPVYAQLRGFDTQGIAYFMSAAVLAGAVGQLPLGRLSDKFDRRRVIMGACLLGAASSAAVALFAGQSSRAAFALIGVFGGMTFPVYAVCVAHLNDHTARDEFVEASSAMLFIYAAGALIGAIASSNLMELVGPRGLFAFTSAGHFALALLTFARLRTRKGPAADDKEPFVAVTRTSPTVYALDPRGESPERDDTRPQR